MVATIFIFKGDFTSEINKLERNNVLAYLSVMYSCRRTYRMMVNDVGQYFNGVICQPFSISDIDGATFEHMIFEIDNFVKLDRITKGASRSLAVDTEFPPAFCKCVLSGCLIIVIGPSKCRTEVCVLLFFC